jgi:hypothetical protein
MSKPNKNGDIFPDNTRYPTISMGCEVPTSGCVFCTDWAYEPDEPAELAFELGGTIDEDGKLNLKYTTLVKK